MKVFYFFISLFLFKNILQAQNIVTPQAKLSASALQYLWLIDYKNNGKTTPMPEFVYRLDANQKVYVSALIEVEKNFDETVLEPLNIHIGTKAGNIWTAQIPLENFKFFTRLSGIKYIDMDQPCAPSLDTARVITKTDSVQSGYSLPSPFTGKDVVVGIIDAGFDYTHPTFYDTSFSHYRVKKVWEEKNITGTPPSGFIYGSEYRDSLSILSKAYDIVTGTHGTHVGGIAAGSGRGSVMNKSYRGCAPSSDIVMVGIYPSFEYWLSTGMTDMLDGINYIFSYAASVKKPAVANLSWGCPLGPRDGNSLFSRACDNLVGPGKIFVLSGGNNGNNNIHLSKTFTPTDTVLKTVCTFSTSLPEKKNWVDIWGDSSKTFCVQLCLYTGSTKIDSSAFICLDNNTHQVILKGANGDTCFVTVTGVASEFNGKPHILLNIYSRVNDRLSITVKGTDGNVNMWQGLVYLTSGYYGTFVSNGIPGHVGGNSQMVTGDLVSTKSAIAVAAYASKLVFTNVSGSPLQFQGTKGAIASFSSKGPTADGRIKPNIAGPGFALASAVSSYDTSYNTGGADYEMVVSNFISPHTNRTYSYAMAAGTSMSAPMVSGIVALLLEADPKLSPQELMKVLYETAIKDSYTGNIAIDTGSNVWGWGKVNAYNAMKKVLENVGIYHQGENINALLYPNPGNGDYSLQYLSAENESVNIRVMNAAGQSVMNEKWNVLRGTNTRTIDLTNKASGIYFITLFNNKDKINVKVLKR